MPAKCGCVLLGVGIEHVSMFCCREEPGGAAPFPADVRIPLGGRTEGEIGDRVAALLAIAARPENLPQGVLFKPIAESPVVFVAPIDSAELSSAHFAPETTARMHLASGSSTCNPR
jgi:hypothetical protein